MTKSFVPVWLCISISAFVLSFLSSASEFKSAVPGLEAYKNPAGNCQLPPAQKGDAEKQTCFADKLVREVKKVEDQTSGGACMRGVRTACERATGNQGVPWCNHASDAGKCLLSLGMGAAYAAQTKTKEEAEKNAPKLKKDGSSWTTQWSDSSKIKFLQNEFTRPKKLPPGTVIVYGGTNDGIGHIEVITDDGRLCSDFCQNTPPSNRTENRWIIGIYLPPPEDDCKIPNWSKEA